MSSFFEAEENSTVSNSAFGDDGGYLGFDSHLSAQSHGSYTAFAAEDDNNGSIQISTDGFTPSVFPTGASFVQEDSIPPSPEAYGYLSDRHPGFNSAASPFPMPDSNGSAYGEGMIGGIFISNRPILPPPSEMHPDEGYFLQEWRRQNVALLEEKEMVEKELRNQIIIEAEEYKKVYHDKRKLSCEANKIENRENEKLFVACQEKFHADAGKRWWKATAEMIPNEVSKIEKRGKKEQEMKASTSIAVVPGPKPGKPTDLSRMRQLLVKLKHNAPPHMEAAAAPSPAPAFVDVAAAVELSATQEAVVVG